MLRHSIIGKALLIGLLCATATANAAIINLRADMDGLQADAGNGTGSLGTGTGIMTFDDATNTLNWTVSWQDLTGTVTAAHFHGPAAPDENAGVQVGIDHTNNPTEGSAILTPTQASDMLSGLWYINVHSSFAPGGEIRGQVNVVPIPAAVWLFGSGLVGLIGVARRCKS